MPIWRVVVLYPCKGPTIDGIECLRFIHCDYIEMQVTRRIPVEYLLNAHHRTPAFLPNQTLPLTLPFRSMSLSLKARLQSDMVFHLLDGRLLTMIRVGRDAAIGKFFSIPGPTPKICPRYSTSPIHRARWIRKQDSDSRSWSRFS
jgi:hypothetical protein